LLLAIEFFGVEIWIIGIIVAIAGFAVPQALIREHPKSWAKEAQVASAIAVTIGIIITITTK